MNVTLTLTLDDVNAVLGALGQRPYAEVAPVVERIAGQAREQIAAQQEPAEATDE